MSFSVTLLPSHTTVSLEGKKTLREELLDKGIESVQGICGGHASCTQCRIKVKEGEHSLTQMQAAEKRLLGNVFHLTKERLSCQCTVQGSCVLEELGQKGASGKRKNSAGIRHRKSPRHQRPLDREKQPAQKGKTGGLRRLKKPGRSS